MDGVERRAFAKVVAGDPEVEGAGLGRVFADATDEHGIDARGVERGGEAVAIVDEANAGQAARNSSTASAFDIER